jgi:hypothetical protein
MAVLYLWIWAAIVAPQSLNTAIYVCKLFHVLLDHYHWLCSSTTTLINLWMLGYVGAECAQKTHAHKHKHCNITREVAKQYSYTCLLQFVSVCEISSFIRGADPLKNSKYPLKTGINPGSHLQWFFLSMRTRARTKINCWTTIQKERKLNRAVRLYDRLTQYNYYFLLNVNVLKVK